MKNPILAFDYFFQLIFLICILLGSFAIFPLMLLVPFGAYQVLSAAIKGVAWNSALHRTFAGVAGVYGALIMYLAIGKDVFLMDWLRDLLPEAAINTMGILVYLVVPVISAIFYVRVSKKDYEERVRQPQEWV